MGKLIFFCGEWGAPGDKEDKGAPGDKEDKGAPGDKEDKGAPGDKEDKGAPGEFSILCPMTPFAPLGEPPPWAGFPT